MGNFKSMLPDFKELSSMSSKLFKSIKSSVEEIIKDYKDKRAVEAANMPEEAPPANESAKQETTEAPQEPVTKEPEAVVAATEPTEAPNVEPAPVAEESPDKKENEGS
jgi:hypothetical protein